MSAPAGKLADKTVLIIGRGTGIAGAIAPGTIDTGAYDALGPERKAALFAARSASNPARRIGTPQDIATVAVMALTSSFLTGVTIPVDGGEHLV